MAVGAAGPGASGYLSCAPHCPVVYTLDTWTVLAIWAIVIIIGAWFVWEWVKMERRARQ